MSYGNVPEGFVPNGSADSFDDREFGWEDEIEKDSPDYITLPEGDYDFEVVDFERARHEGSRRATKRSYTSESKEKMQADMKARRSSGTSCSYTLRQKGYCVHSLQESGSVKKAKS